MIAPVSSSPTPDTYEMHPTAASSVNVSEHRLLRDPSDDEFLDGNDAAMKGKPKKVFLFL
jgi:hypothetical protein